MNAVAEQRRDGCERAQATTSGEATCRRPVLALSAPVGVGGGGTVTIAPGVLRFVIGLLVEGAALANRSTCRDKAGPPEPATEEAWIATSARPRMRFDRIKGTTTGAGS